MAHMQVTADVNSKQMEISLDQYQWESLTVNGESVESNGAGFSKTVNLTQGTPVPYVAIVNTVEILNGPFNHGINGPNFEGFWLSINYEYTDNSKSQVKISGEMEWRNGFIHHAKDEYGFSQGMLTGSYSKAS